MPRKLDPEKELLIRRASLTVLASTLCRCSNSKARYDPFCYACNKRLDDDLYRNLSKPIGKGYEEAYERACTALDTKKVNLT
jgi:hypothetical protein